MNSPAPPGVDLQQLRRYLLTHGWALIQHPNPRIALFETHPDERGDFSSVPLPSSADFSDAPQLIEEALRLVAEFRNIPLERLRDALLHWDTDILRARMIRLRTHESTLPLAIAAETIASLKEFMGYAAYTQANPQPFFDKAGGVSTAFTKHCRFGHTFAGSFGLRVECPLPVVPELPIPGVEPAVPFERQVFQRVATGMITMRASVERDSLDPMVDGYETGFSANMCRALADVYENADGRRIEYDISWSPEFQSPLEAAWKPFLFDGRAYEVSRAAATELEKVEQFPEAVIEGPIIALKSETPPGLDQQAEFDHLITMFWGREKTQTVQIRVPLSPQQYIQACDAHKDGRKIRIQGVPEKMGKFWTLTKPHDFAVLP